MESNLSDLGVDSRGVHATYSPQGKNINLWLRHCSYRAGISGKQRFLRFVYDELTAERILEIFNIILYILELHVLECSPNNLSFSFDTLWLRSLYIKGAGNFFRKRNFTFPCFHENYNFHRNKSSLLVLKSKRK